MILGAAEVAGHSVSSVGDVTIRDAIPHFTSETRQGRILPKFDVTHLGQQPYGWGKRPNLA
jgi:hypothetical protein